VKDKRGTTVRTTHTGRDTIQLRAVTQSAAMSCLLGAHAGDVTNVTLSKTSGNFGENRQHSSLDWAIRSKVHRSDYIATTRVLCLL